MKKIIATLALFIACQATFAQNIKSIINEFKEVKGVEYTKVPRWTLLLGNNKGVKSICYLDLGSCPSEVKEDFRQKVNQLEGYEVLFRGKEDGEMYKLLAKMNNEVIRELIILITGKDDCGLTLMKGKIKKEDIAQLVNEQTGKKDGRE